MGGAFRIVNYKNNNGESNKEDNERALFGGIHQIDSLSENVKQKCFPCILVNFTFLLFCNLHDLQQLLYYSFYGSIFIYCKNHFQIDFTTKRKYLRTIW